MSLATHIPPDWQPPESWRRLEVYLEESDVYLCFHCCRRFRGISLHLRTTRHMGDDSESLCPECAEGLARRIDEALSDARVTS